MSCSKIFSGDCPELTYEVIKYLQNDISTLHSCTLVNRLWCRLAIPLLWENPFSVPFRTVPFPISTKNYNFIKIYLRYINDDFKEKLNEYKIINNSLPSNILFNYLNFLKCLNICEFISSIEYFFRGAIPINMYFKILVDICTSLFKIFIENEINLHTLEIKSLQKQCDEISLNNILELILQNPNFIHNIRNLNLYATFYDNSISKDRVLQIINSHQNLKAILINHYNLSLYNSLLLSKNYNCSNTLNTIVFYGTNFYGIINLDKIFEQLNVLESVHIIYCSLNNNFTQQIIKLTKPFKLKSLFINHLSSFDESLHLLLQKSGDYLENFKYYNRSSSFKQLLLEIITKYCKNIKFFYFYAELESHINYQIFDTIKNIKQNLNYLSIYITHYSCYYYEYNSIILQNLGQALPSKLEYLSLTLSIKESNFRTFLENSQDIFINKLLITQRDSYDILNYIKKYIMKEKRAKYLAIRNLENEIIDLYDLKDEVKEFELHNIRIRSWKDLALAIDDDHTLLKETGYL